MSGNLAVCTDKICTPFSEKPYIIKQSGKVKVAIISVLNPDIFALFPKSKMNDIEIRNYKEFLNRVVPEARKEANLVVVISHSGDDSDRQLAEEIPGIDVIIGGHTQTFHKEPLKIGTTLIVQAGENGHRVGVLDIEMANENNIASYKNSFVLLDKDVPDDKEARALLDEYQAKLKEKAESLVK